MLKLNQIKKSKGRFRKPLLTTFNTKMPYTCGLSRITSYHAIAATYYLVYTTEDRVEQASERRQT
jgi:hypothetical protein